jgi:RNA polymerase sigma-70 factor (ECF subfamily)
VRQCRPAAVSALRLASAVSCVRGTVRGVETLHRDEALNRFFADVERRALRIAEIAVRNRDDALDLVQEAMIKLARKYAGHSSEEWPPLFYRILQNGIRDHQRKQAVRNRVMVWFGRGSEDDDYDPIAAAPDPDGRTPDEELETGAAMRQLESALADLPDRQREAFMLRALEGLDVRDTATAMGVSEGSVKTHYSRAVHSLRGTLGEHWQ